MQHEDRQEREGAAGFDRGRKSWLLGLALLTVMGVAVFGLWVTANLYRQKKITEAQIAARRWHDCCCEG